jgi:glutamate-ammonia-ligase adenylyltransferase
LAGIVESVLMLGRDPAKVAVDAAKMRLEIARHKAPRGPLDIKLGAGGLIDLEFAVHTLQLINRKGLTPRLPAAIDALIGEGLIPPEIAPAHLLLTRLLVTLRLVAPDSAEPAPASRDLVARVCGTKGWEELLAAHGDARQSISELWGAVAKAV